MVAELGPHFVCVAAPTSAMAQQLAIAAPVWGVLPPMIVIHTAQLSDDLDYDDDDDA